MKYSNVLIYGYGKSGQSVEKVLVKENVNYRIYTDDKINKTDKFIAKLNKKVLASFDLIVISPAISINNKYVKIAKKMGIEVVGEVEFACTKITTPIIAVTGTNGKTTTVAMLADVLSSKYKVEALGNIGTPLSEYVGRNDLDYLVVEMSSFQLESISKFKPYISIILNIASDHLDRHGNMNEYIKAKLNICKNNTTKSINVINIDDKNIMANINSIVGKKYFISKDNSESNVYINENYICYKVGKYKGKIDIKDIFVKTNIYNIMVVVLISKLLKIENLNLMHTLKTYRVQSHRLECVGEINGVTYINDSKSTNVHSTLNALSAVSGKSTILLLGGYDKKLDFSEIFTLYQDKIKHVVAYGKCRNRIYKTAKKYGYKNITKLKKFDEAILFATKIASNADIVLLSPASSSYDEFSSYKERGERFTKLVSEVSVAKEQ